MTPEKIKQVIQRYREQFVALGIEPKEFPHGELVGSSKGTLEHCSSMLDRMETFVSEGHLEKAFRWLGFIQGCLWMQGVYSLDALKEDNRP